MADVAAFCDVTAWFTSRYQVIRILLAHAQLLGQVKSCPRNVIAKDALIWTENKLHEVMTEN
jgi:hypothetical protein